VRLWSAGAINPLGWSLVGQPAVVETFDAAPTVVAPAMVVEAAPDEPGDRGGQAVYVRQPLGHFEAFGRREWGSGPAPA
jgi:hypothetical protein